MSDIGRLRAFVHDMTLLVERARVDAAATRADGGALRARLVADDDWLPEAFARPDPIRSGAPAEA